MRLHGAVESNRGFEADLHADGVPNPSWWMQRRCFVRGQVGGINDACKVCSHGVGGAPNRTAWNGFLGTID